MDQKSKSKTDKSSPFFQDHSQGRKYMTKGYVQVINFPSVPFQHILNSIHTVFRVFQNLSPPYGIQFSLYSPHLPYAHRIHLPTHPPRLDHQKNVQ